MTAKYTTRVLKWAVIREDEGWMSDYATIIEVEDEGAGEYLVIAQPSAKIRQDGGIAIAEEEWPVIRDTIEAAFTTLAQTQKPLAS